MGSQRVGRVALMSIHPAYAEAILRGEKTVEFRKRPIADDVTHVIVYATAPLGAVVGAFTVTGQVTTNPRTLWQQFADVSGISKRKFFEYFGARSHGTGIGVGEVFAPAELIYLSEALGVSRPPQSFQYVPADKAASALRAMTRVRVAPAA